jgi:hypothetical protein
MNSASTLRPAQNNSADSEIYIQDYMQSICSLYIHRKMASIYPGQRLFSSFYWVRHPWKQIAKQIASKTRAPEQTTRAPEHQRQIASKPPEHQSTREPEHQRRRRRRRRRRRFTGGGRRLDAVLVVRRRTVEVKSMHRDFSPDDSVLSTSSNSSDNVRMQYQCILHIAAILFILQYFIPAGSRQADDQSCAVARPVRRRQLRQIRCAVREGELSTAPVVGQHVESISFATKPTLPATV